MQQKRTSQGTHFFLKDESVVYEGTPTQNAILDAAGKVYAATEQRLLVTSANDGKHMRGSLHYEDQALDLRVWHLNDHEAVAEAIQDELGEDYDVIAEWRENGKGEQVPSHIHVEKDA